MSTPTKPAGRKRKPAARRAPATKPAAKHKVRTAKREAQAAAKPEAAVTVEAVAPPAVEAQTPASDTPPAERETAKVHKLQTVKTAPPVEEPGEPETPEPVTITLKVKHLRAALQCCGFNNARYYLNGVYLHCVDGELRMVGTDGHRLIAISLGDDYPPLPWADAGIILPSKDLKVAVSVCSKAGEEVSLTYGGSGSATLSDQIEFASFRMLPVDGRFPEYQRVIESGADVLAGGSQVLETANIAGQYLKSAGEVATMLKKGSGAFAFVSSPKEPAVFTFDEPGVVLYVMPRVSDAQSLSSSTARMLGDGLKRSIAALKAHVTRQRTEAAKAKSDEDRAAANAKVEALEAQIDMLIAAGTKSLPKAEAA